MRKVGVVMRFDPRVNLDEGNLQGLPYQLGKVVLGAESIAGRWDRSIHQISLGVLIIICSLKD